MTPEQGEEAGPFCLSDTVLLPFLSRLGQISSTYPGGGEGLTLTTGDNLEGSVFAHFSH